MRQQTWPPINVGGIADKRGLGWQDLQNLLLEIPYRNIGARVMEKLRQIDQVAFVRYASVYRQFQDVGEFIEEIESLGRNPLKDMLQPDLFGSS